ncbi:MAG: HlyD family secretion protein [Devosia sp.]|uniref:HlyD family type I secretion periplasmic adaptor subunit n=1 Tax=Devosia sp. TaxID=1871048 RepID=UPI00260990F5|nr:HlyD family type I secretion periplasmic adaptor subunit [Devosia sp.]MDB5542398.1 HlyD family secretion protein [Devosia sp.]
MADPLRSLGRHATAGLVAIALFAGLLGGWAGTTEIAGAVVAQGTVVPLEGSKRVQHPEGGVVTEIRVKDGDAVTAGQLLLRLDGTTVSANLAVIVSQLSAAFALEARLTAESLGSDHLTLPAGLDDWPDRANLDQLLAAQDRLRQSRADAQAGLATQLDEQIGQLGEQIIGLTAQQAAVQRQADILAAELKDSEALFRNGLVEASRLNTSRRELARLEGEAGNLTAEIASARTAIAGSRAKIAETTATFRAGVLEDLRDTGLQIAELLQQKIAAEDRLAKLEIRAPQAGIVHESIVRTVGGVVSAGETLMQVVPRSDRLALEARVSPLDVDKLTVGQAASVRLVGLDARTTPELAATVQSISPDLSRDPTTGAAYFSIRLSLSATELARLPHHQHLVPGMPAEAFLRTADRTVLSYLLGPLAAQLSHAFRED